MANNLSNLNESEKMELANYAYDELPKQIEARMEGDDRAYLAQLDAKMGQARNKGERFDMPPVPPGIMLPDSQIKYNAIYKANRSGRKGEASGYTPEKASAALVTYEGILVDGTLTKAQDDKLLQMSIDGFIPSGEYARIHGLNEAKKAGTATNQPWQNSSGYGYAISHVKNARSQFAGPKPEKPKNAKGEKLQAYESAMEEWKAKEDYLSGQAKLELNKDAQQAHAKGIKFDGEKWWMDHIKKTVNDGSIISPEVEKGFWSKAWDKVSGGDQIPYNPNDFAPTTGRD